MKTLFLLTISNVFMTAAWYGHLKYKDAALWRVILISWAIAFVEYCFQVPANRWGHMEGFSVGQLKIMQEAITLVVFCAFVVLYGLDRLRWNEMAGIGLVLAAVAVANYHKW